MGIYKGKIKPSNIILIILYSISTIILIYLTINSYFKLKNQAQNKKYVETVFKETNEKYNEEIKSQKLILDEINDLKNLDSNINKLKNDVFELAKELEEKIVDGKSEYKIAYLTFDDGPYYLTNEVLSILKENKIKATFFTIGYNKDICFDNKNESCADTYKKIVDNGHTIANHTYSHAIFYGLYNSVDSFMNEVKKQEELIESRTGVKTNIVRFPGGSPTAGYLKDGIIGELRNNGYGWVDWTAQDGDGGYLPSTSQAWYNLQSSINEPIEVILFHDYSYITVSILPDVINYLEDNNYILLPLFYDSIKINK